jgi:putative hydrolase of the HAD superfamily
MSIRAVLFDLDNTLTHRGQSIFSYSQYLAAHYQPFLFEADPQQVRCIVNGIDNGGYPDTKLLTHSSIGASVAYALLQELSWREQPDFEELTQFWFRYFGRHAVAMAGALELLNPLKQAQYKLAVVSNGGHATRLNILQGLDFSHFFDEIISSESAGVSKPEPEIFLYASQRLGVEPKECLFIGDHPINDVQGALGAGMQAVLLEGFHTQLEQQVTAERIQKLDQLRSYLSK